MSTRILSVGGLTLCLTASGGALTGLDFSAEGHVPSVSSMETACDCAADRALLDEAERQIAQYFAGQLKAFDLPLAVEGTPFRRAVWGALTRIPYGETSTYGGIAREIGSPRAARAVGGACHHNPIAIIIPCHRVVGADDTLTGFGGGLDTKAKLLALESANKA